MRSLVVSACLAALLLGGCSTRGDVAALGNAAQIARSNPDGTPPPGGSVDMVMSIGPSKIQHVVFLIQENRTFDYIFGGLDDNGNPFPGADTVSNPLPGEPTPANHLGQPVTMQTGLLEDCYVPNHSRPNAVTEIAKKPYLMDGFDKETVQVLPCAHVKKAPANFVYKTVNYNEVTPYWNMGEQYAISDRMFESSTSASFAAHLYYVAGQSSRSIDNPGGSPWGCDEITPPGATHPPYVPLYNEKTGGEGGVAEPCFSIPTLADELDAKGIAWRYYAMSIADFGTTGSPTTRSGNFQRPRLADERRHAVGANPVRCRQRKLACRDVGDAVAGDVRSSAVDEQHGSGVDRLGRRCHR